jgi:hypothetical protein
MRHTMPVLKIIKFQTIKLPDSGCLSQKGVELLLYIKRSAQFFMGSVLRANKPWLPSAAGANKFDKVPQYISCTRAI